MKPPRELECDSHEQWVLLAPRQDHEVVIRHLKIRNLAVSSVVVHRWIRHPCLTSVLEVLFKPTPLVPLECTVCSDEKKSQNDDKDDPDLRDFRDVPTQVVNNGRIHVIAEADCLLLWHEQRRAIVAETAKRTVNVSLQVLKWSIDAVEGMRMILGREVEQ